MVAKILLFTDPSRCMPCRMMDNALFSAKFDVSITTIQTGSSITPENKEKANKYNIRNIPQLVFVDSEDNELSRLSGFSPTIVQNIKNKIKEFNGK